MLAAREHAWLVQLPRADAPMHRQVGYQIRLESRRSSRTRLLFCTTGVLLRRLQCDRQLRGMSHVFVDEIHERDLNSDFLLIILRQLLRQQPGLKLVLMSATLNAELFAAYFGNCPVLTIPGRAHPVRALMLEDAFEHTGFALTPGHECARKGGGGGGGRSGAGRRGGGGGGGGGGGDGGASLPVPTMKELTRLLPSYSQNTRESLLIAAEEAINYDLICALVRHIHATHDEGAILVFLPGLMEITRLYDMLVSDPRTLGDRSRFRVYPLHSTLSTAEQQAVFELPPAGVRKVVIATNIAETSITIEDVVFVIDSGRVKENRYDSMNKMAMLVETWVSLASAKQRRGRAGRVRPGIAYHLFSSRTAASLPEFTLPEMLRVPLDETILQIKVLDLGEVERFLGDAVNPPEPQAITTSLECLRDLQAVDPDQGDQLTPLGYHLASLPVDPRLGKVRKRMRVRARAAARTPVSLTAPAPLTPHAR